MGALSIGAVNKAESPDSALAQAAASGRWTRAAAGALYTPVRLRLFGRARSRARDLFQCVARRRTRYRGVSVGCEVTRGFLLDGANLAAPQHMSTPLTPRFRVRPPVNSVTGSAAAGARTLNPNG